MKRKTKFTSRIDVRMTEEQMNKLIDASDKRSITPVQLLRNLIDNLK